ncbi:unnamed protein product [Polarella glacialis]|uniref:Uncharacterized protein n=1 Tax=Polarella glacialis TaxID=89957 RepID=A0A813JK49_POLGL|nr:unnamed protein product [Polarella glacialis]
MALSQKSAGRSNLAIWICFSAVILWRWSCDATQKRVTFIGIPARPALDGISRTQLVRNAGLTSTASQCDLGCREGSFAKGLCRKARRLRGILRSAAAEDDETIVPIGPFCPFVSDSFVNMEACMEEGHRKNMERIINRVDQLAEEAMPDTQEQLRLGQEMREADSKWRANLMQMRYAEDFQTRELFEFTEAHLRHLGVSIAEVESFASWQADVLESFGRRQLPPTPSVDPSSDKVFHLRGVLDSLRLGGKHTVAMSFAPPKAMDSPVVQEELQKLERDHAALINFGQRYGAFDSGGKKIFLDQVSMIEERWAVYLARFRLMGEPVPSYMSGASDLLKRLGLTASRAEKLVSEAHDLMRKKADQDV